MNKSKIPPDDIAAIGQALADYLARRKNPPRMNTYGYSFMQPMGQSIIVADRKEYDGSTKLTKDQP
jgi:hypothetical protein